MSEERTANLPAGPQAAPQQVTVADLAALGEVARSVVQAVVEPQEQTKQRELQVEEKAIAAIEHSERRVLVAVMSVFLSVAVLAGMLILRNRDELAVSLIDRMLYFLAGGLGGWGVARARQAEREQQGAA